jgi:hypothetical protein
MLLVAVIRLATWPKGAKQESPKVSKFSIIIIIIVAAYTL